MRAPERQRDDDDVGARLEGGMFSKQQRARDRGTVYRAAVRLPLAVQADEVVRVRVREEVRA